MALLTKAGWKRKDSKREAALVAVILASGVWMITAGLMEL
jgi:hypothetical protein